MVFDSFRVERLLLPRNVDSSFLLDEISRDQRNITAIEPLSAAFRGPRVSEGIRVEEQTGL